MKRRKLGEILLDRKHCSDRELKETVEEQQRYGGQLGELLLASGAVEKDVLVGVMQEVLGIPYRDCAEVMPDDNALTCINVWLAKKHCVQPLRVVGKVLQVVMAEPQDIAALDELRFASGLEIQAFFGFRGEILQAIRRSYGEDAEAPALAARWNRRKVISSSSTAVPAWRTAPPWRSSRTSCVGGRRKPCSS